MAERGKKTNTNKEKKNTPSPVVKIKGEISSDTPINKLDNEKNLIFERLEPLREQAIILIGIRKERDALNDKVKLVSEDVRKIKTERDELNKLVQDEKKKRDDINQQASSLRKVFKKEFGDAPTRRGSSELQMLRKKVKNMRWEIETQGFNFAEEKKRSKVVKDLEKRLKTLEQFDNARMGVVKQDKDARTFHSNVMDLSKKSEEVHQNLVALYEKLKAAREKADAKHQDVVDALDKLKKIEAEHETDLNRLSEIRGQIQESKEEWEVQRVEEGKKSAQERGAEAFAEFEKGGRVDLRDLQLKFLGEEKKKARKRK
jgi:phosphoserine phosphatase